mmetsp:Transcript_34759/g.102181  ORF Transcript_34759/g.102181 Transcript_34759/m.102181 type:complete len:85 (-) Transcript_34759:56-310(-)
MCNEASPAQDLPTNQPTPTKKGNAVNRGALGNSNDKNDAPTQTSWNSTGLDDLPAVFAVSDVERNEKAGRGRDQPTNGYLVNKF